jgi:nucleoside-diphosphate-sugar epimerase
MTDNVVVFGASSYVGARIVESLLSGGHRVVAVSRRPAMARALLPEESDDFAIGTAQDAERLTDANVSSIVNLAYVKDAHPRRIHWQNRLLVNAIRRVASRGCRRVVHISTAAVFGYRFAEPPSPVRVRRPPPDLYAESKLHAEHLLEGLARKLSCELAIVRLGNVIGPGSPLWVAELAQRIMEVKPAGYEREEGFSNTTHVKNIADYIGYLIGRPAGALDRFGPYHHLAEFSSRRWPELLDVMSAEVGYPWTTVGRPQDSRPSIHPVKRALKAANRTPAGRYLRAGSGWLPDSRALDRLNAWARGPTLPQLGARDQVGAEDVVLLEVLSSEHEFRSRTMDGWRPTLDFPSACGEIADWLRSAGYSVKAPESETAQPHGTPAK